MRAKTKKNKTLFKLADIPTGRFKDLRMKFLPLPEKGFGVTWLHENLPPFSDVPEIRHKKTNEAVFVTRGCAWAYLDGKKRKLRKGDFLLIRAGVAHRFKTAAQGVQALSLFSPAMDPEKPDVHPAE